VGKLFAEELHRRKEGFMKSLRRRMTEDMQVRGLSPQTQASALATLGFQLTIRRWICNATLWSELTKCRKIYEEHASGKNTNRPELEACLKSLRTGDTGLEIALFWTPVCNSLRVGVRPRA